MSRQDLYDKYRCEYRTFVFESYSYNVQPDGLHISFSFAVDERVRFSPEAFFPARRFLHPERLGKKELDSLVFNIGMVELVSYWKCYCPQEVVVIPHKLTDGQVSFWKKLYFNGLGEFFYTNGIETNLADFMHLHSRADAPQCSVFELNAVLNENTCDPHIVPIGGGKDSVVTLELLDGYGGTEKDFCKRPLPLIMNPRGATEECVRCAGYTLDDVVVINRRIDPALLEINAQGGLNGHTPFSAMLAFYTILASAMNGRRFRIALSNEGSANESTVAGTMVNHQYSKSMEFENDFRAYVRDYISPTFNYYSFLRPLCELQIAALFSKYNQYHDIFRSCNVGSKTDVWCGHCAKCLFAFIILSPFLSPERLSSIFGHNLLNDMTLKLEFDQLTGNAQTKPFECVGTVAEVNKALEMTLLRWYCDGERPALLVGFQPQKREVSLLSFDSDNNLPQDENRLLKEYVDRGNGFARQDRFVKLLAGKEILIAGYGREGKSTERLLGRIFPSKTFDIAANDDEIVARLEEKHYDLIIKSPGIPMMLFEGRCDMSTVSSQSDLFLLVFGDKTVAVTGTKGKSTTTRLIYEVLRKNLSSHVVMAGNMGIPLFDVVDEMAGNAVVVAELSCHQLENIHKGPHIGVSLNLFQEHLDHYHDYAGYRAAKMQMAIRQTDDDVFIYCHDNEDLRAEVEQCRQTIRSRQMPYSEYDAIRCTAAMQAAPMLKGRHNRSNMYAVWLVASQFGIGQDDFEAALNDFKGLEHRLEYVGKVCGVDFYNDSISTIPQTAIAAIEAVDNVETIILGGFDRGIDYTPLTDYLTKEGRGLSVRNIVFLGKAGKRMCDELSEKDTAKRAIMVQGNDAYDMEKAVQFAALHTSAGHACLLSPAASSYDRYENFEYRGNDFKQAVNLLKTK